MASFEVVKKVEYSTEVSGQEDARADTRCDREPYEGLLSHLQHPQCNSRSGKGYAKVKVRFRSLQAK